MENLLVLIDGRGSLLLRRVVIRLFFVVRRMVVLLLPRLGRIVIWV